MLTYSFDNIGSKSLYEFLYERVKKDIIDGVIGSGEKLPSKRTFAKNLGVSTVTVENAYGLLLDEGYIYSIPKKGYFAAHIPAQTAPATPLPQTAPPSATSQPQAPSGAFPAQTAPATPLPQTAPPSAAPAYFADFVSNRTDPAKFPFSTWMRLFRETTRDNRDELMTNSPSGGILRLREAICTHLYQFRGIKVSPKQIIVGAGTEYLYSLLIQLLGRDLLYAVETPGYKKIPLIYEKNGASCTYIPMDSQGIRIDALASSNADVLHISPSHHFPTGIVTPVSRRYEILAWAQESEKRYIIEDDYDSEFRLSGRPLPALQSIDTHGKVICINSFTKSLSSTIRISYMALPPALAEKFYNELGFYSCTVSSFEQYTLARFLEEGYFEKHINRMRKYYKNQRDAILDRLRSHPAHSKITITEENSGLHFLIHFESQKSDSRIIEGIKEKGINISALSQYELAPRSIARQETGLAGVEKTPPAGKTAAASYIYEKDFAQHNSHSDKSSAHTLLINYSGISPDRINEAVDRLMDGIF